MPELHDLLERRASGYGPPSDLFERVVDRRRRRDRKRRIGTAVAALAVAAVAIGGLLRAVSNGQVPAEDRLGIFGPLSGRILYVNEPETGDLGYDLGLWAVDPDGPADTAEGPSVADDIASTLERLRLGPGDADTVTPLAWSRDGTELLFKRTHEELFPEEYLYVLHADGSETQLNEDPLTLGGATISPDGTRVVYAAWGDDLGLYVVDIGGPAVRLPLPAVQGIVGDPTFSPDGARIAFVDSGEAGSLLWVMDVDGANAQRILADEATLSTGGAGGLQWSPAGDLLAVQVRVPNGSNVVFTFAPDGSGFTQVIRGALSPHWSPDGSHIAYTIECEISDTSCGGLAIVDPDGSNVREFGYAASGPWHPGASVQPDVTTPEPTDVSWRAEGEALSFTGVPGEASGDLVAVDPVTGAERVLVEDLDVVYSATWSADGNWVAYETGRRRDVELWVVGASQEPRQVAAGASMLAWSSTGAELVAIRLTSGLHTDIAGSTLSLIDPATGGSTDVGSIPEGVAGDVTSAPAWAPDGSRFVFGARGGAIYSVDVGSGADSLLVQLPGALDSVDQIVWSPDGAQIAVVNDGNPGGTYVMDADGSNVRVLLDGYSTTGMAWSPDGTRLAFADDADAMVWVASMDGSPTTLIGPLSAACGESLFACREDLVWSPDGSRIALRSSPVGDGTVGVSVIDADGGSAAKPLDELTVRSWDGGGYSCECR